MRTIIKYTGDLVGGQIYMCRMDNSKVVISNPFKNDKGVWTITCKYTDSITKENMSFSVTCFDFERDIASRVWLPQPC